MDGGEVCEGLAEDTRVSRVYLTVSSLAKIFIFLFVYADRKKLVHLFQFDSFL